MKKLIAWLALSVLLLIPASASALTDNQFCYGWYVYSGCFDSKSEAIDGMKAVMPAAYRPVIQEISDAPTGYVSSDYGLQWQMDFLIPDQPPEQMFNPGYIINGWGVSSGICASAGDPLFPELCADGDAGALAMYQYYLDTYPSCTFVNTGFEGAYAQPFRVIARYSWDSRYGVIDMTPNPHQSSRRLSYTIQCPGWEPPEPEARDILTAKQQTFLCADGFLPVEGDAATVSGPLCRPSVPIARITYYKRQTNTCPVGNPCHPATGDKSRNEVDFQFAGESFTRYYHSLAQVGTLPAFAPGWTHTYSDRITDAGASGYVLTKGDGYVEYFTLLAANEYQSSQSMRKKLVKLPDGSYKVYEESGRILSFNASGRLVRQEQSTGSLNAIDFTYDGEKLILAQDHTGRALAFQYVDNRLDSILLPDGGIVQYEFDAIGNFVRATYPDGTDRQYHYNESGLSLANDPNALTGITTENGHRYGSFGYNAHGRANLSRLHKGDGTYVATVSIDYADVNQPVVTMPTGEVKTYGLVDEGAYRRITSITGGSGTYHSTYAGGGLTQTIMPSGSISKYDYEAGYQSARYDAFGTPQERKIVSVRDVNYRLSSKEIQAKSGTAYVTKQSQAWAYNARGQMLTATTTDPATSIARTITMTYCEQTDVNAGTCPLAGLVMTVDGARTDIGDVSTYSYRMADAAGCAAAPTTCQYRKGDLWKVTNALGQISETLKYDGAGRVLSVKDPNGVVTDFEYDARGWMTARKVRGSNGAVETDDAITRIEYWPTGLVKKVTQPDGAFTSYAYDTAHRLTGISDNAGNSISYTLNAAGDRTKEETKDTGGVLQRTLSRTYNTLGQLQTATDAYGRNTGFTYDANGNLDTTTDALTRVADNDYDPLDRLSRTLQDMGGIAAETKFTYDVLDNLTQVKDPKRLNTNYTYNGFSDLTQLSSPDTGNTIYTYDSAGNRASQTDARSKVTNYGYDALNRLTSVEYPATTALNTTYTYDIAQAACVSGETFTVGRLTKIVDGSGNTVYCYDRFGNLVRKVQTTNAKVFTLRYTYNVAGQLTSVIYPGGAIADYLYDAQGRVSEIGAKTATGTRQVLLNNVSYYPFGPASQWTFGTGTSSRLMKRSLNQNYQPGFVEVTAVDGISLGYEFDEVGNLKKLRAANQADPPKRVFGYDGLNRLLDAKDGTTNAVLQAYAYDKTGNRTSATVGATTTPYTYPTGSHLLSKVGANTRAYDFNGNTTSIPGTVAKKFVYGDHNRMTQYKEGTAVKMNYVYNGRGEQVRKYASGTTNVYSLYDEAGHWLGDYNNAAAATQQVIWFGDLPVGVFVGAAAAQKLHYIEADALGTPRVVVDPTRGSNGTAVWTWDLAGEAFGTTAPNQNPDGDANQFVFNMRFAGQRYDAASGLNYNYFRDGYEPGTGRYTQPDPVGLRGGLSSYGYVSQRPLTLVDPKGLLAFGPTCNAQMRAAIIQAVIELSNEITSKANSAAKNCEKGNCDFSLAGDVMRNVSAMTFSCDNTFLCAQALVNGVAYYHPTILTAPNASEILKPGQCGCLKGTIFHEATHQAHWDMSENEVRRKALNCVSCAQNVNENGGPL